MPKSLVHVHRASGRHWVGDGFPVQTVFGYDDLGQHLSPYLMFDYAAPTRFEPASKPRGVGEHPHRGFETVTVVFQGELEHRDSGGGGGRIGPGDVQWMTAAGGIVHDEFHSEAFTREGGELHMAQLWVNLPAAHKRAAPAYQSLLADEIPVVDLAGGGTVRLISGAYGGHGGAARTFTPVILWEITLPDGASADLPAPEGWNLSVFPLGGSVTASGQTVPAGSLGIFSREDADATIRAAGPARLLVLGGEPIDEPVVGYGPFVMNTREEILEAFRDFQAGRMGQLAPAS
jgi:hypothetical protein